MAAAYELAGDTLINWLMGEVSRRDPLIVAEFVSIVAVSLVNLLTYSFGCP